MLRQQMATLAVEREYGFFMIRDPRSLTLPGQGCCGPVSQSGRRGGRMGDLPRRRPSPSGGGSVGWTGPPVRSLCCGFGHRPYARGSIRSRSRLSLILPLSWRETSGSRLSNIFSPRAVRDWKSRRKASDRPSGTGMRCPAAARMAGEEETGSSSRVQ